ncbi:SLATT domain-containing protein [Vibrio parahaemolyticus]|uniref:SLATT domain-containing protein n=1 Tax=Vibrio parahaemolyticus TaxID=670 RepID=UPI00111F5A57|nr:SLATT domain-containing protein [Vibrio parahaemolyticus]TPA20793.1 SLATT domain-containing protein [Vibrio parahaemolyticus]
MKQNELDVLIDMIRMTERCKYEAASRMRFKRSVGFFATTTSSMILLLIPLLQLANYEFSLSSELTNAIQVYFAICTILYSVIIGVAGYDKKEASYTNDGRKLANLREEIQVVCGDESCSEKFNDFLNKYRNLVGNMDNHGRSDYYKAAFSREQNLYSLYLKLKSYIPQLLELTYFSVLVVSEIYFVFVLFGIRS